MGRAYPNENSLACLLKRVEKALRSLAACACLAAFAAASVSSFARADDSAAPPTPQAPRTSDASDTFYAESPADLNEEAQSLLARRKWAEAAILLRSEVRRDPRSASASADLAKALLYLRRREEAVQILNQAIELNRGTRKAWLIEQVRLIAKVFVTNASFQTYQDGADLLQAQRQRQARDKFEQVLGSEPSNVEVLTRLGQSYLLDGDYDSAAERLKLALRLDPYEPEIHLWLGRTMVLRGEKDGGLAELRQAASQLGQSELAPTWLAEALVSSGQSNAARAVLEQDVKNNPLHVGALVELAKLKIRDADSEDTLWSARKDFQNALSRLSDYEQPGRRRFEGELGVEILQSGNELRDEIQSQLQKLESRLEAESDR